VACHLVQFHPGADEYSPPGKRQHTRDLLFQCKVLQLRKPLISPVNG
jgi:hypothetical protein